MNVVVKKKPKKKVEEKKSKIISAGRAYVDEMRDLYANMQEDLKNSNTRTQEGIANELASNSKKLT